MKDPLENGKRISLSAARVLRICLDKQKIAPS